MMDPLEVARAALEALNHGEWDRTAALVDPEDVERWFGEQTAVQEPPRGPFTVEGLKRYRPDLPHAVAEYQAEQLNRRREESWGSLRASFAGVSTREALTRLSPVEALSRYLQANDPAWQFEEEVRRLHPALVALARPGLFSLRREVVGIVHEGEEMAHVVYRAGVLAEDGSEAVAGDLFVVTLRPRSDGWKLRLRGELFEPGGSVMVLRDPEADIPAAEE